MKILIVSEVLKGGVETYFNNIEKCKKIQFVYLLPKKASNSKFVENKNVVFFFDKYRILSPIFITLATFKYSHSEKTSLVYANSTIAGYAMILLYILTLGKLKYVYCSHGYAGLSNLFDKFKLKVINFLDKLIVKFSAGTIDISSYEHQYSTQQLKAKNTILIEHGIDHIPQILASINLFSEYFLSSKINILFVGRLDKQKGIDILLNIVKKRKDEKLYFHIVGDNVQDSSPINYSNSKNVKFYGWQESKNVNALMNLCDVVIVPSRWEGFGYVVIEAFRAAKPVIVSNRGALPYFINKEIGFIFDLNNEESLHKILNNLSKEKLQKQGIKAYETFEQKYKLDVFCQKTINYLLRKAKK